ncbi:MAG: hcnC [Planctomycetota bacterium]|nr:hcnC [Planctomycetota bacterium]
MSEHGQKTDVVIVGGGVIGLSIAYALSREGVPVTLLDRGRFGQEASWAGAGIISPGSERPTRSPVSQLRTLSARLHEEWAVALREETGIDNGYRRTGGVDVALEERDEHDLEAASGRWREEGIAFERLRPEEFSRVEPALGPEIRLAYFLPDRAQIRNPRHLRALAEACKNRGVILHEHAPALGFGISGERVDSVLTAAGPISCARVVLAAGAWSGQLMRDLGVSVATRPVRGQIVLLAPGATRLRRIVEHGKNYLVPRDDGRILIGSTEEDVGFDRETTPQAIAGLHELAARLCPALRDAPIERSWAGLRPGSIDTRPYLGLAPGHTNLFVATGHQRAGLQLSTGTAALMADLLMDRNPSINLSSFRVDRGADPSEDSFRS